MDGCASRRIVILSDDPSSLLILLWSILLVLVGILLVQPGTAELVQRLRPPVKLTVLEERVRGETFLRELAFRSDAEFSLYANSLYGGRLEAVNGANGEARRVLSLEDAARVGPGETVRTMIMR